MSDLVILGLAAHRFWVLWFQPSEMRTPLTITRDWLAQRHRLVAKGATCTMCMSLWTPTVLLTALVYASPLVWILALSEAIMLLEAGLKLINRSAIMPAPAQIHLAPTEVGAGNGHEQ